MNAIDAAPVDIRKRYGYDIVKVTLFTLLFSLLCFHSTFHSEPLTPLWFTTATLIPTLFSLPARYWPAALIGCGSALAAANALVGSPIALPLLPLILAEGVLSAWLLRLVLQTDDPLNGMLAWLKFFIIGVLLTSLLGALSAFYLLHFGAPLDIHMVAQWFTAEATSILSLAPVILLLLQPTADPALRHYRWPELLTLIILTLAICYVALTFFPFPYTFIIVPLLIGAIRLPRFEAFVLFLVIILALFLSTATNLIQVDMGQSILVGPMLHLPLLMILIPANTMAMAMHAFHTERRRIEQSETRFRNAMEYSAIGMALVSLEGNWIQVNKALCRFLHYRPQQLSGLTMQQLTYPDDLASDLNKRDDLVAGKIDSYTMEKRYIRSDGEIVWALLAVSLVRDAYQHPLYFISQIEDITEVKRSALINQRLMERITLANEAGGVGTWEWDLSSNTISWDTQMERIYGVPAGQSIDLIFWLSRVVEEDRDPLSRVIRQSIEQRIPIYLVFRIRRQQDEIRHVRAYATVQTDSEDRAVRLTGINLDMTNEASLTEALHEEKERLHITLDSIGDAVISVDEDLRINFMNPVAEKMTGWEHETAYNHHVDQVIKLRYARDGAALPTSLICDSQQIDHTNALDQSVVLQSTKGQVYDIQHNCTPLYNLKGKLLGAVLVLKDVSESRQLLQQLSYNALHDVLTGLPNRANFEKHMESAILTAIEQKRQHALVFMDLDRFKHINDNAGHAAGDALLIALSQQMKTQVRQFDCVARMGGDEFSMILLDCRLKDAKRLVQRIIDAINDYRFHWDKEVYRIGASAGITLISEDNYHSKELISQADTACYAAKYSGRGQALLYEPSQKLNLHSAHRPEPLNHAQLLDIIYNDGIQLMATAAASPQALQLPALYRLSFAVQHRDHGSVSQELFLVSAQRHDLLSAIDSWLIGQLFTRYDGLIAQKGVPLAVPLSLQGLADVALTEAFLSRLDRHPRLSGRELIISLSGTLFLQSYSSIAPSLDALRQRGCKIMLEQFGADLAEFDLLPVGVIDYIRVPEHLIAHIHTNPMDERVVSILNGHIHRLSATAIAGPADTAATVTLLRRVGTDLVEGEAVSRSLPLSALLESEYDQVE